MSIPIIIALQAITQIPAMRSLSDKRSFRAKNESLKALRRSDDDLKLLWAGCIWHPYPLFLLAASTTACTTKFSNLAEHNLNINSKTSLVVFEYYVCTWNKTSRKYFEHRFIIQNMSFLPIGLNLIYSRFMALPPYL